MVSDQLIKLIRLDPFAVLPREISLKILGYLDAISLCRAAQVNKSWSLLADDDVLWRGICEQHIGQKCHKCGWGLPMLERRRKIKAPLSPPPEGPTASFYKRDLENYDADSASDGQRPVKRIRSESSDVPITGFHDMSVQSPKSPPMTEIHPPPRMITRPWKDVYSERLTIERNWRRGRCTVRTLKGHVDGVMCLQFSENLHHPSFPVLITGSYDRTARVWNLETGTEIRCLNGHSRAVRALQFDEAKLITGSMDNTMRVWNWRTGKCIRILEGHSAGVVCLNFDSNVLASGSVDRTIKIWNFRTGECFTLRGHRDWVNSVQLWDSTLGSSESNICQQTPIESPSSNESSKLPTIDPGKMLFSGSDDGTIMLWDLATRTSVRTFSGHVGQVQSIRLVYEYPSCENDDDTKKKNFFRDPRSKAVSGFSGPTSGSSPVCSPPAPDSPAFQSSQALASGSSSSSNRRSSSPSESRRKVRPMLISGSLDNTIRVWDVDSGKSVTTLFGHIEGVWAVACDKLRLASASHDRTIKVCPFFNFNRINILIYFIRSGCVRRIAAWQR